MWYSYYDRPKAKEAKGGIKAQSQRGSFGQTWWAKRWVAVLESFDIGARLSRGRTYARKGQVLDIQIDKGKVTAKVQGSMPRPYAISIQVKELVAADWQRVTQALGQQAAFAAKLLAGEMPQEIEEVFQKVGVGLFPERLRDLETSCSCPDYSNPCKHIAAVYYIIGEEFDRDPFLLFKLRGMERETLLKNLGGLAPRQAAGHQKVAPELPSPEPLPVDAQGFWQVGDLPADFHGVVQTPPMDAALPKRLGSFPLWRGQERFLEALEPIYRRAALKGLATFLGETSPLPPPAPGR
jgi:uncharacterized Zn finger protein